MKKKRAASKNPTPSKKRIQVTLDITIPADWNIGETECWLVKKLRTTHAADGWRTDVEVGMQRMKPALSPQSPHRGSGSAIGREFGDDERSGA